MKYENKLGSNNGATSGAIRLSHVAEVIDCEHKTAPTQDTGYPSIRTPNVGRGRLILENVNRVSEETYAAWTRRGAPEPGDLILAREAPVGNVAIVPKSPRVCLGQRTVLIRPDRKRVDPEYLTYLLLGDEVQHRFHSASNGATVHHLNVKDIRDLELPTLPPLPTQRKIASILSAYDDLIENNQRRIRILEEMARMIYREWFVEFRFPGHKNVKLVESEMGLVPEGWKVVKMTDVVAVGPVTTVPKSGEKPFVPMGSLSTDSMLISDVELRGGNSGSKFRNGDTLVARITPCLENGKTGFVQFLSSDDAVAFGSTEFIVLRSRSVSPEFVYLLARSDEFRNHAIKSMTGATGRQRVQEQCFDQFPLAHPGQELILRFSRLVRPSFDNINQLHRRIRLLQRTRDLLLPKLISGDLDISRLDIALPESPDDVESIVQSTPTPIALKPVRRQAESGQQVLAFYEKEKKQSGKGFVILDEVDTNDIMAAFRAAAREGKIRSGEEMIESVATHIGEPEPTYRTRETLKGHMRAAVRRKILGAERDTVWLETPTMATYTRDELIDTIRSVMRKGVWYERQEVIRAVAEHLGFKRLRESVVEPVKSAINGAIRRGILERQGSQLRRD